ncbi:unnamed protein product [Urochloa humidicola]
MKLAVAAVVASLLLAVAVTSVAAAGTFHVTNNAPATPGGQRFDCDYGASYAARVLSETPTPPPSPGSSSTRRAPVTAAPSTPSLSP